MAVLVLLLCAAAAAQAAKPEPYGANYARAGRSWPEEQWQAPERAAASPAPEVPGAGWLQSLEGRLESLELAGGPYEPALAEPLADLARALQQAGEPEAARGYYRRALHIVRINDGLYSERQVPLLRALLASLRQTGDYPDLDDRHDYLFRLYGSGQPPHTGLRLRATLEYLRWQREALRRDLDDQGDRRLLRLLELNEDLLQSLEADDAVSYPLYREAVLSQLRNLYLLLDRVQPPASEVGLIHYNPLPYAEETAPGESDYVASRLEARRERAVAGAAELLEALRTRAQAEGPRAVAEVTLELADWYQWNGRERDAAEHYREVETLLLEHGEAELVEALLRTPRELPDNGAFWQAPSQAEVAASITARFDVTADGRARNVATSGATEAQEGAARNLRRRLARTRFRPRIESGSGRSVSGVVARYEVYD